MDDLETNPLEDILDKLNDIEGYLFNIDYSTRGILNTLFFIVILLLILIVVIFIKL